MLYLCAQPIHNIARGGAPTPSSRILTLSYQSLIAGGLGKKLVPVIGMLKLA